MSLEIERQVLTVTMAGVYLRDCGSEFEWLFHVSHLTTQKEA